MNTNTAAEVTETVDTLQLAEGDLLDHHGMRIRLGARNVAAYLSDANGEVVWFEGHVENYDEIKATPGGHVTDGLLRADRTWTIQGNHLAPWRRVIGG